MLNWLLRRFLCKLVYFFNGVAMKKRLRTAALVMLIIGLFVASFFVEKEKKGE